MGRLNIARRSIKKKHKRNVRAMAVYHKAMNDLELSMWGKEPRAIDPYKTKDGD